MSTKRNDKARTISVKSLDQTKMRPYVIFRNKIRVLYVRYRKITYAYGTRT